MPALDQSETLEEQVGRRAVTPLTINGHTFPKGTRILQVDPQYVLGGHCGGDQLSEVWGELEEWHSYSRSDTPLEKALHEAGRRCPLVGAM